MRVLNSGAKINEVNSLEHVKKDLSLNMNKIIKQLKTLFSDADNSKKNHFENNYLQMEQISFQNLNELLSDLEWTKKYFNDLKRGEKN
ncbi:MAG: hypothetical protein ABI550_06845 [Ignavibacteriaceae bacterium]